MMYIIDSVRRGWGVVHITDAHVIHVEAVDDAGSGS